MAGIAYIALPIIELRPNRLASGVEFPLTDFTVEFGVWFLFGITALVLIIASPLFIRYNLYAQRTGLSYEEKQILRGFWLAVIGNAMIVLTLILPERGGERILLDASAYLSDDVVLNNPRILPTIGLLASLFGGYMVLFAGLEDLKHGDVSRYLRLALGWGGLAIAIVLFTSGALDGYSFMVELGNRGENLRQYIIEHITFVSVSLMVGFILGISLGLWASRSEQVAPVILYSVGIIQTVPSLALFGLLLSPLAAFGSQLFSYIFTIILVTTVIAVAYFVLIQFIRSSLPEQYQSPLFLFGLLIASVPLTLITAIFVAFLYQIILQRLVDSRFYTMNNVVVLVFASAVGVWLLNHFVISEKVLRRQVTRLYTAIFVIAFLLLGALLVDSAVYYLRGEVNFDQLQVNGESLLDVLTISNLGISGIGVAPALVALTLYSLLPLVRNTYAGLNNVDPAIIDSGRGMGMTPAQIFFRIELPLALPVIMAGVRNAGVALVGIGTIAQIIGGGGLGRLILQGINSTSIDLMLLGLIPAVILALALDSGLRLIENLLTSPGVKQETA